MLLSIVKDIRQSLSANGAVVWYGSSQLSLLNVVIDRFLRMLAATGFLQGDAGGETDDVEGRGQAWGPV